ncbi:transglutaminase-like superfamily protein [mine drainage metagenome]|uniref:Transglutaminase-like superfamily protein n=1 Tax=mine drainage metagenome TaxID=410659 RepID=A0A1J5SX65_9ZZZZ
MNTLKTTFILLTAFLCSVNSIIAQDKTPVRFGKIKIEDFDVKAPAFDSAANAVVVADWGNSEFAANTTDLTISLQFTKKTRIKILNKNGFDAATVNIYLYTSTTGSAAEKLESLKAYTYNIEDGKVVETKVENSSVFTERKDKHWVIKKFTFPALKEGSLIEYSYTIKSDFISNLQAWAFQGEYPCLWSEYNAGIPEFYRYVTLSQGYRPFFINKVEQSQVRFSFRERYEVSGGGGFGETGSPIHYENFDVSGSQDNHRWVMKNVPGLKPESFTTTLNNHIAKIEFQLAQIHYPNTIPRPYMSDWKKVAESFKDNDKFGVLIDKSNGWLDDNIKQIVAAAKTQEEKARNIFQYVRDNISEKNDYGIYATTTLKDVFKNKSGNVADINLLLVAMLRHEKIDANPIILSTRSRGVTNEIYPLMDRYNYVIVKALVDGRVVYLDAADSKIGFGKLPLECYNGHAREVTKDVLTPVYFYADSLKETSLTNVFIINDANGGKPLGTVTENLGYYSSLYLRNKLANMKEEQYEKEYKTSFPENVEMKNFKIDSLKNYDDPIAISYETSYSAFGDNDIVYFNPLQESIIKKNPFVAAQRFYPVEMSFTQNQTYTLTMEIPKGYVVDELPKSTRLTLNGEDGMFEYIIQKDAENIQMRVRLKINKANFTNEDYETLRDFYAFIFKKQSEQIVFKKVKS